jgi:tetratricopeptide (TPR) repeat protein
MNGLTYKLKPIKNTSSDGGMDYDIMSANILAKNVNPVLTPQLGYLYRNLNRSDVYYDENVQRMVQNYRFNFMKLAQYEMNTKNDREKAKRIFNQMEETIPLDVIPMQDWRISAYFMSIFSQLGDTAHFNLYAKTVETTALDAINNNKVDAQDPFMPYRTLLDVYDARKDYQAAIDILNRALVQFPNVQEIKSRIQFYEQKLKSPAIVDTAKVK